MSVFWNQVKKGDAVGLSTTLSKPNCEIDVNEPDPFGFTPVHWAVHNDFPKTLRVLHSFGACLDVFDADGQTPLHLALTKPSTELAAELLSLGANIHLRDSRGLAPVHQACASGALQHVAFLLDKGASVTDPDSAQGMTPLHIASADASSPPELLRLLLRRLEQDPPQLSAALALRTSCSGGFTPLMIACLRGHAQAVLELLQRLPELQANLHAADDGSTPLHIAVQQGHSAIAEHLLRHGADPALRNTFGLSAAKLAQNFDFPLPGCEPAAPQAKSRPQAPPGGTHRRSRRPRPRSLHASLRQPKSSSNYTSLMDIMSRVDNSTVSGDLLLSRSSKQAVGELAPQAKHRPSPSSSSSSSSSKKKAAIASLSFAPVSLLSAEAPPPLTSESLPAISASTRSRRHRKNSTIKKPSKKSSRRPSILGSTQMQHASLQTPAAACGEPAAFLAKLRRIVLAGSSEEARQQAFEKALRDDAVSLQELQDAIKSRMQLLTRFIESEVCIHCKTNKTSLMALPCSHFNYCASCISQMTACQVCQSPLRGYSAVKYPPFLNIHL